MKALTSRECVAGSRVLPWCAPILLPCRDCSPPIVSTKPGVCAMRSRGPPALCHCRTACGLPHGLHIQMPPVWVRCHVVQQDHGASGQRHIALNRLTALHFQACLCVKTQTIEVVAAATADRTPGSYVAFSSMHSCNPNKQCTVPGTWRTQDCANPIMLPKSTYHGFRLPAWRN